MATVATQEVSVSMRDVTRQFGRRTVFSAVSGEASAGQSLVISGANGSGKSTLLKIVAGLLAPSRGEVSVCIAGRELDRVRRRPHIGYVAPDLALYAELTGAENLQFFGRLQGISLSRDDMIALLTTVGLRGRGRDYVGDYSSGMRQRLKYAVALLHRPALLLLDEPTANLDADGVAIVKAIIDEQKRHGVVMIATNDAQEVAWGDTLVQLTVPH
jgi:heme exporter protein A